MKKITTVTAFAVTIFSLTSCSSKIARLNRAEKQIRENAKSCYEYAALIKQKKDKAIYDFISTLTIEEKLSQVFLINLENNDKFLPVEWFEKEPLFQEDDKKTSEKKIKEKKTLIPGGYIFFGYNVADNPVQIINFTESIKNYALKEKTIPPFLSIDVEGGFVNRLRKVCGPLPENERVAACINKKVAFELYQSYAIQLKTLGFDFNLAPVSEICTDENREFLSGRSFGNEMQVLDYSTSEILAYENNGIGTVVKHFPGNTNTDPHIGLPKINMNEEDFNIVTETFASVLKTKPEGLLMSHAIVPEYDEKPACLSKFWVTDVLKDKLHYDGIIFSDDIFMGALIDNGYSPEKASRLALDSGIDCIMISEKKFGRWMEIIKKIAAEDEHFMKKIDSSVYKMIRYKVNHGILKIKRNKEDKSYSIYIPTSLENEINENDLKLRLNEFDKNKEITRKIYFDYFYSTAGDEEKIGLYVE